MGGLLAERQRAQMKTSLLLIALVLAFGVGCRAIAAAAAAAGDGELISSDHHHDSDTPPPPHSVHANEPIPEITAAHPRLVFADAEIPAVMAAVHRDPILSQKFDLLRHEGEKILSQPPAAYVHDTEKALIVSRLVLTRVGTLAGLYRLTGDARFAARARTEMLAAAAFPDWHADDFLPTAELLNAEGLGYDWLYHYLSSTDRSTIYHAILNDGLLPAKEAYGKKAAWTYTTSNHNVVGNGGVAVAAVAIADEDRKLAQQLISDTRRSIPPAMSEYAPDGAWPEGPIYWDYATRYAIFYLSALDSGLGTDFGASTYPGFADTGMFRIQSTGPTKGTFNFGDAEEQIHPTPFMFYLANRFHRPIYAAHENYLALSEVNIFEIIWRSRVGVVEPFEKLAEKSIPLDALFRGVDVAFMRGDWLDPGTTWVGFKAGTNKGSHRHLDLGSFVMDALGERWALDLGPDDYGLPGYNGSDKRWTYYRCSTEGHNTLTINSANQNPDGDSKMLAFRSGPDRSYAVVDMTAAYPHAKRVMRGIELLDRRNIAIIDEVETSGPARITWNFHTKAKISIDATDATLRLGGKILRAEILSPKGATFEIVAANPPPPQKQEPEVHDLIVHLPERVSKTRIIVLLSPIAAPGGRAVSRDDERIVRGNESAPKFEPLQTWIDEAPVKHARASQ
jgi:hypothetical protein